MADDRPWQLNGRRLQMLYSGLYGTLRSAQDGGDLASCGRYYFILNDKNDKCLPQTEVYIAFGP